jgi:hypothetical protein
MKITFNKIAFNKEKLLTRDTLLTALLAIAVVLSVIS